MTVKPPSPPTKDALREIAIAALVDVSKNAKATPAARAAAARTLLESIGDIGRLQEIASRASKPLTELSATEIEEEISRMKTAGVPSKAEIDQEIKILTSRHRDIKA